MQGRRVAFIPARSGSKRIPNKNIRLLGGHPLMAYSIRAALDSKIFDAVVCVTDSADYAAVATHYGASVPALRPANISGDRSPDIEWVVWALKTLAASGSEFEFFSILRPTSPFRLASTIQRAWALFAAEVGADSLRAVEKVGQHPGKMWIIQGSRLLPLLPFSIEGVPWHSNQYAALPEVFVQNASLEFARCSIPMQRGSIAGEVIVPFVSEGREGFDVNEEEDWLLADAYLRQGIAQLPPIHGPAFN